MKIEKREMTLNEKDTLKDVLAFERTLLAEYVSLSPLIEGEERRENYCEMVQQILHTIFSISDLLRESKKQTD